MTLLRAQGSRTRTLILTVGIALHYLLDLCFDFIYYIAPCSILRYLRLIPSYWWKFPAETSSALSLRTGSTRSVLSNLAVGRLLTNQINDI